MITLQHSALFALAVAERKQFFTKLDRNFMFLQYFHENIPWLLLPDAIRAYIGPRQPSHFEKAVDGEISWMCFPDVKVLKELTKENAQQRIKFGIKGKYPNCVIGETTQIGEFDVCNYQHRYYHTMRSHLVQDCCLDSILRLKMIQYTHQLPEDHFIIRHNGKVIRGKELRKQIALFEHLGFIKLVGLVYKKTGLLLTREWFDSHVYEPLKKAYPADLAEKTYSYMSIDDQTNDRIKRHDFEITEEEKASVTITDNLDGILKKLYSDALCLTCLEI